MARAGWLDCQCDGRDLKTERAQIIVCFLSAAEGRNWDSGCKRNDFLRGIEEVRVAKCVFICLLVCQFDQPAVIRSSVSNFAKASTIRHDLRKGS